MPELPEVETTRRQLEGKIVGRGIVKLDVGDLKVEGDLKKVEKAKITAVKRKGKILVIELGNGYSLQVHFRMTGYFYYSPEKKEEKFTKVKFFLDNGALLGFVSVRKLSRIKVKKTEELWGELEEKIGVDALSKEFTLKKFREILRRKKGGNVKETLMKQELIAGVGNIYAQEAIYYAKIDPHRQISTLSQKEIEKLYHELIRVLKKALGKRGTTAENYRDIYGEKGEFWGELAVYGQKKCPQGHEITKEKIGGRGTSFCPRCQR